MDDDFKSDPKYVRARSSPRLRWADAKGSSLGISKIRYFDLLEPPSLVSESVSSSSRFSHSKPSARKILKKRSTPFSFPTRQRLRASSFSDVPIDWDLVETQPKVFISRNDSIEARIRKRSDRQIKKAKSEEAGDRLDGIDPNLRNDPMLDREIEDVWCELRRNKELLDVLSSGRTVKAWHPRFEIDYEPKMLDLLLSENEKERISGVKIPKKKWVYILHYDKNNELQHSIQRKD